MYVIDDVEVEVEMVCIKLCCGRHVSPLHTANGYSVVTDID